MTGAGNDGGQLTAAQVVVSAVYPGASAQVVADTVTTPLEQQINGVEKGIYLKSTNANDGTLTLKVSFEVGSDQDMDNVLTQNRVSQAQSQMPQSVKNYGVAVKKALATLKVTDAETKNPATERAEDELKAKENDGDEKPVSAEDARKKMLNDFFNPKKDK